MKHVISHPSAHLPTAKLRRCGVEPPGTQTLDPNPDPTRRLTRTLTLTITQARTLNLP